MSVAGKKRTKAKAKRISKSKNISDSYDKFKEFEGKQYTGMKVGRSHKRYYE